MIETAIIAGKSLQWGDTPVVAILHHEAAVADKNSLIEWIKNRVDAKYQRVSDILIRDEFPRNAAGKTHKISLRENYHAN